LRVASVPASHVYVRHLSDPDGSNDVVRLDDPVPKDGRTVPGGWWPPLMLEPGWITDNQDRFDVFHVHFGFDAIEPRALADVMQELKEYGKPLLYTMHDLRNPHHPDQQAHSAQQDILVAAADTLITLTPGAAQEIQRRWGRPCHVLPHPHVLEREYINRPRRASTRFVIGLHTKSLRANMDPLPVIEALTDIVSVLPHAVLQIDVHDEIFDPDNYWFAPRAGKALLRYDRHEQVCVRVHPYFSDDEFWDYLASLTVSLLPYRFGSHSGWLEACFDLGTAVIAPSCGFYGEQRSCGVFEFTEDHFNADSLRRVVDDAYRRWEAGLPAPRATWPERLAERTKVAMAHRYLYENALQ
jgi:hypothetical protein